MKRLLVALVLGGWALAVMADVLEIKKDHPDQYVVKKGDTLWDISGMFLEKPWRWPEIWNINPQVKDPHWIYPGDVLTLIYVNGRPQLVVSDRAPVKVSGDGILDPHVRMEPVASAIPAIPLEKISAFLSRSRIVTAEEMNAAPYVVAGESKKIISGAGDKIYARGNFDPEEKVFGVFRAGKTYIDPVTKEPLGLQAVDIGLTRVDLLEGEIATLTVNETNEEIRISDRLLSREDGNVLSIFNPKAPNQQVKGQILDVEGGVSQVGALSIVAINLGEREGIEVGDVLAVAQKGEVVKDKVQNQIIQLPDVRAGLLIVFRRFEKMSYGLVVTANRPLRVNDTVANP